MNWLAAVIAVVLVIVVVGLLNSQKDSEKPILSTETPVPNRVTNQPGILDAVNKPFDQFTPDEKAELERVFEAKLKPAIANWGEAYKGRIPFDVSKITLDKFHSKMAGGFYTFMMGDTTFTVLHNRKYTKVFYMMTKQAAKDLNSIPTDGSPRDLSVPISREEVLKMATADTGLHYELKDIVIRPTGAYCIIDGGAEVEVGIKYQNGMMLVHPDNLGFVIGKDGKLITYQH